MSIGRELLVRADDMGASRQVNEAILRTHTDGIVCSASLMAVGPAFAEAVRLCAERPSLSVGLHIALMDSGPQRPVSPPETVPSLVDAEGHFWRTMEEVEAAAPTSVDVETEMRAQIARARTQGLHFCYLDYHMGLPPAARPILARLAAEHGVIVEQDGACQPFDPGLETWECLRLPDGSVTYQAGPAFTAARVEAALAKLRRLGAGRWWWATHPGQGLDQSGSMTELLCSTRLGVLLEEEGITRISHRDLWEAHYYPGGKRLPERET